ncbi:MAG: sigma factor-like helix-turn-helix DNA-binding protein [Ferruginibacter sp.]
MECEEIIKPAVTIEVLQRPENKHLQARLFNCIYTLFQSNFLCWILNKYRHTRYKEKLWEDAKDAFQNGLSLFYLKSQQKEFTFRTSLKTTIFSFGFLQLLASFKKEKSAYGARHYIIWFELFFEDDFFEKERQELLDDKEHCLMTALAMLPKKHKDILIMKFFQKLKSREIATILNVTPGNIDNQSTKAYKELREILKSKFNLKNETQWN